MTTRSQGSRFSTSGFLHGDSRKFLLFGELKEEETGHAPTQILERYPRTQPEESSQVKKPSDVAFAGYELYLTAFVSGDYKQRKTKRVEVGENRHGLRCGAVFPGTRSSVISHIDYLTPETALVFFEPVVQKIKARSFFGLVTHMTTSTRYPFCFVQVVCPKPPK